MRSTLLAIVALVVALVITVPLAAQDFGSDTFDPPEPSAAFDLKDMPLGITLLQMSGLKLTESKLESEFTRELGSWSDLIKTAIDGKGVGYLLKVELYSDEYGTPVVPSGQLVFPVGAGVEPADALAEFIRRPRLEGTRPTGFRNDSYYLWVKQKSGKFIANAIPREFREQLEKTARSEAERRNLLGEWERALPPDGFKSVQRAAYWNEVNDKYTKLLADKARREKVDAMVREFNEAQTKFNQAYKAYQQAEIDLARQQDSSKMLKFASAIVGVLSTAEKAGAFKSSGGSSVPVRTDAKPQSNLDATIEYSQKRVDALSGYYEEQTIRIRVQSDELQKFDSSLRDSFEREGIPIPKAEQPYSFPRP